MERSLFDLLESGRSSRCILWSDPDSGLRAILVIDDLALGVAAGGIRTRAYPSFEDALKDAMALARAMTIKCALGRVDAGGAKVVVMDHPGMDRAAAFARLGQHVEELGGVLRTAGDLGTTQEDLATVARHCQYVESSEGDTSEATGRSVLRCIEACAEIAGKPGVSGLRVAVQGCGEIGAAVARVLAGAGIELLVADVDSARAQAVAAETGARVIGADQVLTADCDILAPCAVGGVMTTATAERVRAWAVCGGANNILAEPEAERRLLDRNILFVPDVVSSAGAVVEGIGRRVMLLTDTSVLIDALGETARELLDQSRRSGRVATALAHERAQKTIEQRRLLPLHS